MLSNKQNLQNNSQVDYKTEKIESNLQVSDPKIYDTNFDLLFYIKDVFQMMISE